jgi:hypothetical protein
MWRVPLLMCFLIFGYQRNRCSDWAVDCRIEASIQGTARTFFSSRKLTASWPVSTGGPLPCAKRLEHEVDHLTALSILTIHGVIPPLAHTWWKAQKQLYRSEMGNVNLIEMNRCENRIFFVCVFGRRRFYFCQLVTCQLLKEPPVYCCECFRPTMHDK